MYNIYNHCILAHGSLLSVKYDIHYPHTYDIAHLTDIIRKQWLVIPVKNYSNKKLCEIDIEFLENHDVFDEEMSMVKWYVSYLKVTFRYELFLFCELPLIHSELNKVQKLITERLISDSEKYFEQALRLRASINETIVDKFLKSGLHGYSFPTSNKDNFSFKTAFKPSKKIELIAVYATIGGNILRNICLFS
ncbi:unnamed protein product [Adineta ricciae]|uniref:Uncharacterized protein n=1 Tax=Adineta ricciae TaxID=249248 RepID=A0A814BW00_ADIRI|nr:unnamed protein product [Adineta ricciae]